MTFYYCNNGHEHFSARGAIECSEDNMDTISAIDAVDVPITDFADRVIDDPEKLRARIYQLEQMLATIHELTKI